MTTDTQKPYLSITEYRKLYGVGEAYVRKLIREKRLPGVIRMGKGYKIPRGALPIDSAVTESKEWSITPEGKEAARKREELARESLDVQLLEIKMKKAELEGTLLKGEEIAKKEAELRELADSLAGERMLLDDRERKLNEREEKVTEAEKYISLDGEAVKRIEERERVLEQKSKMVDEQQAASKAESEMLVKTRKELENKKQAIIKREESVAQRERRANQRAQGLADDIGFLLRIVNTLEDGDKKEREKAIEELKAYDFTTLEKA